jgi:DNA-binding response OmpR family regulator
MAGKKVLIVDDDMDLVKLLTRRIAQADFEVLAAFDASQAIRLAQKEVPAVIVLDIKLPGGGGFGTLHNLRISAKTSAIPVIVITGEEEDDVRKEVAKHDLEGFMIKPLDMDALVDRIRSLTGAANSGS